MKLIKRIICDLRGPNQKMIEAEAKINEELTKLQESGGNIIDIKEVSKDSGSVVLVVLYDMPNLTADTKTFGKKEKG